jgi:protein-S-isoprenylcysteine O-methyltransferase Ste14
VLVPVAIGLAAFAAFFLWDVADLRGWRARKGLVILIGIALAFTSFIWLATLPPRLDLPLAIRLLAAVILALSLVLSLYSIFIEPLVGKGDLSEDERLVTTGTYALCRHPGALWSSAAMLAAAIAADSAPLLIAAPLWISLELLWVSVQDLYVFPRLFPGYPRYRQTTPFVLPTVQSVQKGLRTLPLKKAPIG